MYTHIHKQVHTCIKFKIKCVQRSMISYYCVNNVILNCTSLQFHWFVDHVNCSSVNYLKFSRTCINFSTIFLFHHNYFTCFLVVKVFFFWIQNGGIFSVSWMAAFFSESKMAATRRLQKELGDIRKAGGKNFRDIQVKDYHKLKKRKKEILQPKMDLFAHHQHSSYLYMYKVEHFFWKELWEVET